jgi:methylmalonyl-CoA epimerase
LAFRRSLSFTGTRGKSGLTRLIAAGLHEVVVRKRYKGLLVSRPTFPVGKDIGFLPGGDSEIELLEPINRDSGIARYLAKRGEGLHHICLEVDDITGMLVQLKEKGVQLINEEPKVSADGRKYAFVHPKSANGVMVELYELH